MHLFVYRSKSLLLVPQEDSAWDMDLMCSKLSTCMGFSTLHQHCCQACARCGLIRVRLDTPSAWLAGLSVLQALQVYGVWQQAVM